VCKKYHISKKINSFVAIIFVAFKSYSLIINSIYCMYLNATVILEIVDTMIVLKEFEFVMNTFDDANNLRGKPSNLIFHSDQGVQYTSDVK